MRNSSESFASISYSTVTSTGPSLGSVASTSLGFRQWSQVARSAVASGNREIRISTGDAAVPMAAATKENWVPRCPATYPQNALPAAHEPIYTSRKTASALARTQSGATLCITALIRDITAVQAAPPNAMATDSGTTDLNVVVAHSAPANNVVPMASVASADSDDRTRCSPLLRRPRHSRTPSGAIHKASN